MIAAFLSAATKLQSTTCEGKSVYSCSKQLHSTACRLREGRDVIIGGLQRFSPQRHSQCCSLFFFFLQMQSDGSNYVKEEFRPCLHSPLHMWPIAVLSDRVFLFVSFGKLQSLSDQISPQFQCGMLLGDVV